MGVIHNISNPQLCSFVDFLWISEAYVQPHAAERILATANMGLVVNIDDRDHSHGACSGPRTLPRILNTAKPISLIGVSFRPGGAFPFLPVPVSELQNFNVAIDTLWGSEAVSLRAQLVEARTATARFRVLESFLLAMLVRAPHRNAAVEYALSAFNDMTGPVTVRDVTERTGLSARHFIESFRNEVGVSPKAYCRLARFRAAVSTVAPLKTVDWAATAAACGYFDQSHFINEFHEFAGVSPSAYLRLRTSPNHVRIPA